MASLPPQTLQNENSCDGRHPWSAQSPPTSGITAMFTEDLTAVSHSKVKGLKFIIGTGIYGSRPYRLIQVVNAARQLHSKLSPDSTTSLSAIPVLPTGRLTNLCTPRILLTSTPVRALRGVLLLWRSSRKNSGNPIPYICYIPSLF
jgi:hypothetical protein